MKITITPLHLKHIKGCIAQSISCIEFRKQTVKPVKVKGECLHECSFCLWNSTHNVGELKVLYKTFNDLEYYCSSVTVFEKDIALLCRVFKFVLGLYNYSLVLKVPDENGYFVPCTLCPWESDDITEIVYLLAMFSVQPRDGRFEVFLNLGDDNG